MIIRHLNKVIGLSLVALLTTTSQAHADTVGGILTHIRDSFVNIPEILAVMAYMSGLLLFITGVFKFKDHVEHPSQNPISVGIKRFFAGGLLFSTGFFMQALVGTLFGSSSEGSKIKFGSYHGGGSGEGMDALVVKLVRDFAGPMQDLLILFAYISAIVLMLVGIHRLTKTAQDGPRGPAGLGTIMTFLASGALFSFGGMMGAFVSSVFGSSTVSTYAQITATGIPDADKVAPVIEAVMVFVMIVGYIAFIRGWFVLKAFAEGQGNATLAQGLTFLFGGTLAINLGALVNALQASVGISGISFGGGG